MPYLVASRIGPGEVWEADARPVVRGRTWPIVRTVGQFRLRHCDVIGPVLRCRQLVGRVENMETYKIIRFVFKGDNEVIAKGLTLEEAQEHCRDESTHGEGWFDGYDREGK